MTISGKIKKKKALVINQHYLRGICEIVKKYCNRVVLSVETVSNTNITFDSLDELLNYDNFKPRRIKTLEITGYNNYHRRITICVEEGLNLLQLINYTSTVNCSYEFNSTEEETLFINDFNNWFEKCKASYWLLGKFSLFGIILAPSLLITLFRYIVGYKADFSSYDTMIIIMSIVISIAFILSAKLIDKYFLANIFPPIVFAWGEEIRRYTKWNKLRSNILWGIIVAVLVGLVTSYLFETLWRLK